MSNATDDIIMVSKRRVSCDGGGGALGHPKVWMDMGLETEVICKYCGQLFRLRPDSDNAH